MTVFMCAQSPHNGALHVFVCVWMATIDINGSLCIVLKKIYSTLSEFIIVFWYIIVGKFMSSALNVILRIMISGLFFTCS